MRREARGGVVGYRFETLPEAVEAVVSTRHGGVSPAPFDTLNLGLWTEDEAERVVENRRRLFAAFGLPLERSVWCRQVHADGVAVVGEEDAGRGATGEATVVPDADALVTDTPALPLCRQGRRLRPGRRPRPRAAGARPRPRRLGRDGGADLLAHGRRDGRALRLRAGARCGRRSAPRSGPPGTRSAPR